MKPQEHDELAKYREFEAISARLTEHDRKVRVTLLVVVLLNAVAIALLVYLLFGRV